MPAPILVTVLDRSHEQDESQRKYRRLPAKNRQLRELVQDRNDKEVDVGDAVELLEEIARDEGEHVVLGRADRVSGEQKPLVRFSRIVDVDESGVVVGDFLQRGDAESVGFRAGAARQGLGQEIDPRGRVAIPRRWLQRPLADSGAGWSFRHRSSQ